MFLQIVRFLQRKFTGDHDEVSWVDDTDIAPVDLVDRVPTSFEGWRRKKTARGVYCTTSGPRFGIL